MRKLIKLHTKNILIVSLCLLTIGTISSKVDDKKVTQRKVDIRIQSVNKILSEQTQLIQNQTNRLAESNGEQRRLKNQIDTLNLEKYLLTVKIAALENPPEAPKKQQSKPRAPTTSSQRTTPATSGSATPSGSSCQYSAEIHAVFGSAGDWATRIAWRESRCQAGARNPSGASGLFQLMMPMHSGLFPAVGCIASQWDDPMCNIKAAYHLYKGSGTRPWNL